MPPDAEPVKAERIFVDRASETSGPPSMDSTQSRTISNAGTAATTAPKPTKLATLSTGRAEALAPASTVSRSAGSRRRLNATRGAVVTLLAVCGTTHQKSYFDIVMVGIVGAMVALVAVIVLGTLFGSF